MSDTSKTTPAPEPFRVPDEDLDDLASTLAKTMAEVRQHGVILDRLGAEPAPIPAVPRPDDGAPTAETADFERADGPTSVFILALGGEAYTVELAALSDWVNYLFLPVYGREISTTRPPRTTSARSISSPPAADRTTRSTARPTSEPAPARTLRQPPPPRPASRPLDPALPTRSISRRLSLHLVQRRLSPLPPRPERLPSDDRPPRPHGL